MLKRLSLLLLTSVAGFAQITYVAQKTTVLTGAAEVITIQQPSSGAKFVQLKSLYADCSVACTLTVERNGTPATATTLAVANWNPGETSASATAFSGSNAGVGTVSYLITLIAGSYLNLDLSAMNFPASNNRGYNFTVRTSSITGIVNITVKFTEQ